MKRQKHKESKRKNGLIKEIVLFLLLKQSCPIPIEEKAISYRMTDKQGIPFIVKIKNKEMTHTKKPSPDTGKVAALAVGRGKCEQKRKKRFLQSGIKYLPVILERSEESRQRLQDLTVLTCIRKHAPIASQARHFPPCSGEANTKEEEI